MTTTRRVLVVLALQIALASGVAAQAPRDGTDDPFAGRLFPPELILSNQSRLGLSDDQRRAIMEEMKTFQGNAVSIQWDLRLEMEALQKALDADRITEKDVLDKLARVFKLENDMKTRHMLLVIRIKNSLLPKQIAILKELAGGAPQE